MYIDRIRINWDKVSADSYLTRIPAICLLQELAFRKPVTFFVGENGTGKSTLLEALAQALPGSPASFRDCTLLQCTGETLSENDSTYALP